MRHCACQKLGALAAWKNDTASGNWGEIKKEEKSLCWLEGLAWNLSVSSVAKACLWKFPAKRMLHWLKIWGGTDCLPLSALFKDSWSFLFFKSHWCCWGLCFFFEGWLWPLYFYQLLCSYYHVVIVSSVLKLLAKGNSLAVFPTGAEARLGTGTYLSYLLYLVHLGTWVKQQKLRTWVALLWVSLNHAGLKIVEYRVPHVINLNTCT